VRTHLATDARRASLRGGDGVRPACPPRAVTVTRPGHPMPVIAGVACLGVAHASPVQPGIGAWAAARPFHGRRPIPRGTRSSHGHGATTGPHDPGGVLQLVHREDVPRLLARYRQALATEALLRHLLAELGLPEGSVHTAAAPGRRVVPITPTPGPGPRTGGVGGAPDPPTLPSPPPPATPATDGHEQDQPREPRYRTRH